MASLSSEAWEPAAVHDAPEMDGPLIMALLEESHAEDGEDERLGCVMQSLEAEIGPSKIDGSSDIGASVELDYDDSCMDDGSVLEHLGILGNGRDCSMSMCGGGIDDPFDCWVDMGMASGPHCDGMGQWYLDTCTDEVGMVGFGFGDIGRDYYSPCFDYGDMSMEVQEYSPLWQ